MKEVVKMKENIYTEPMGSMPQVGAMQHMQANPNISPVQAAPKVSPVHTAPKAPPAQTLPETMPAKPNPAAAMPSAMNQMPMMGQMPAQLNPAAVMPSAMNQMPMMGQMPMMNQMPIMCCPYLMNMQCPMTPGQNVMGMNMMNNMMYPAVSPASGGMDYMPGSANPVLGAAEKAMSPYQNMGTLPSMNNRYHYQY